MTTAREYLTGVRARIEASASDNGLGPAWRGASTIAHAPTDLARMEAALTAILDEMDATETCIAMYRETAMILCIGTDGDPTIRDRYRSEAQGRADALTATLNDYRRAITTHLEAP